MANCIYKYKGKEYTKEEFYSLVSSSNFIQQEQAKKFAELQERLNNKEFLEGAKNAYESTPELQQLGTQEEYNDYIARVSLGIIKNPSSGKYNYTSKVKDIVYHGTNLNFDKFDKTKIGGNTAVKGEKPSFSFSNNKQQAEAYSSEITVGQNTNELAEAWFEENQHVFKNGDINTGIIDINNVFDHYKKELGDIVLDRLLDISPYKDFGVELNIQNIDNLFALDINVNTSLNITIVRNYIWFCRVFILFLN